MNETEKVIYSESEKKLLLKEEVTKTNRRIFDLQRNRKIKYETENLATVIYFLLKSFEKEKVEEILRDVNTMLRIYRGDKEKWN